MKKLLYLIPALGLLAAACQQAETDYPDTLEINRITASMAPDSKTVLANETQVWWSPGDAVLIASSLETAEFVSNESEPVAVTYFEGQIRVDAMQPLLYGLYPSRQGAEIADGVVTTTLPDTQQAVSGSFANRTLITMGRSDNINMPFYQVCGGLCFSVTEPGVTTVRVGGGTALAGRFQACFGDDGKPVIQEVLTPSYEVSLYSPNGFTPGVNYYIVLLPGTHMNGLMLCFEKGETARALRMTKPVTIKRGIFARLLEADAGLTYESISDPVLSCDDMQGVDHIDFPAFSFYPLTFPATGSHKKDGTNASGESSEQANRSNTLQSYQASATLSFSLTDCTEDVSDLSKLTFALQEEGNSPLFAQIQEVSLNSNNTFSVSIVLSDNGSSSGTLRLALTLPSGKTITSDAIPVKKVQESINYRIAKRFANAIFNNHYRRAEIGIGNVDSEASKLAIDGVTNLNTKPANEFSNTINGIKASCDEYVLYNETLDLMNLVCVHQENGSADHGPLNNGVLKRMGFKWQFEVVKGYQTGAVPTFQENFVTLSNTDKVDPGTPVIFTPRAYGYGNTRAAVGHNPIIRVSLLKDNKMVECAYIKVYIEDTEEGSSTTVVSENVQFDFNGQFNCYPDSLQFTITVKQMSDAFYYKADVPPYSFHQGYVFDPNYAPGSENPPQGQYGRVDELYPGASSIVLAWKVSMDDIWKVATANPYTGDMSRVVYYRKGESIFTITFHATVKQFNNNWDIFIDGKGQYNPAYWVDRNGFIDNVNFDHTRFNAFIPRVDETNEDLCLFENNLNAPFKTDATGKIFIQYATGVPFSDFKYYFHSSNNQLTIGGVKLKVKNGEPENLYASKSGVSEQLVAKIYNNGYTCHDYDNTYLPNAIVLDKTESLARELLNVGYDMFEVHIGATGTICNDDNRGINIKFNGKDYFVGRFICPVTISSVSIASTHFIMGVDDGEEGSYIQLRELIKLLDWRGREFGDPDDTSSSRWNYWQYYGVSGVSLLEDSVISNIYHPESSTGVDQLPTTMKVYISGDKTGSSKLSQGTWDDYLVFHNNGINYYSFKIFLKLMVDYTWGSVVSDEIVIPVDRMI